FHQGDHGYDVAFAALQLLLGRRGGSELDKMLVEGYTEYRTEELMLLMLRRGYEGGGGIEAELVGLAERAHGTRGYAATAEAMRRAFASQPYGPFVALVRALLRQDGGEAMLAAFVARGDVSPLVQGLGARRWTLIAQLAELYGRYSDRADKQQSHFTEASGLGAWLAGKMADVVEGNTASREEIERIRRTAEDFLAAARDAYAGFSPSRRFELLGVLAGFDFDSSADVGAEIAARIRAREAVGPAHRVQAVLLAAALSLLTAAGVFGLQPQDVSPPWQSLPLWVGVVQLAASLVLLHLWPVYVAARGGMQFMLRFLPSSPIDTRRPS
ncbi:MAG TPA: hypothetical protein VNI01_06500, partial [Elusimicrobiota bacterium]|nr:hypothetical protein [Elusimicrobiota bacterium]